MFASESTKAIRLPFQRSAWRDVALGTVLGSTVICMIVGAAVLFGYGHVRMGTVVASDLAIVILTLVLMVSSSVKDKQIAALD